MDHTQRIKTVKVSDYLFEIPKTGGMLVPGRVYVNEKILKSIIEDRSIEQVVNVAHLPGIQKYSIAMPDIHLGYGFPIGGVAATDIETGVISPGGVGYDINCGVRLMRTNLTEKDVRPDLRPLVEELFRTVPCGPGIGGKIKLSGSDYKDFTDKGVAWAIEKGWGVDQDLEMIEDRGYFPGSNIDNISQKALERGKGQLGSLGSGNHFLEINVVDKIDNLRVAEAFGLSVGQVCVLIHCGSRGFGHQICSDYINKMLRYMEREKIRLPDKQLACAHINSKEGKEYLSAFAAAVNYAWINRQIIMHLTREAFLNVLGLSPAELGAHLVYDVSHNIAKIEEHIINGETKKVCVHRKGATRSFPKNHPLIPEVYKDVGQPVMIPGDMGRASYVLVGTKNALEQTFGTCCHGAGRLLSRRRALKQGDPNKLLAELSKKGIEVIARKKRTVVEEMPDAYKKVEDVCDVVHNAGIARKVARLRPIGVIKG
ncbi:MAG: RtcB family protein [Candidatus Dadabacteria bacterium]|nr:RtcB family protein [Candidatus Dadabacteria bacterium]NIS09939.1 RtcB family protein [Candidatus Dadabacteria bacterium]NIY22557.1 RNA-splicing ligase RtcB [Candidatus Dadabacteria bacterium]